MDIIILRGGGDLATGIAYTLHKAKYKILILEIEKPSAVRRTVAFGEAVYEDEVSVEGIKAALAKDKEDIKRIWDKGAIPVYIDKEGKIINDIRPFAVVDAIIAKKNLGTDKSMAPITIGVGPGFEAGIDVDLVVESQRGPTLGRIIHKGKAIDDTRIPGDVMGYTKERVLRAPCDGKVKAFYSIGDVVEEGQIVCKVEDKKVRAPFTGLLRGMIRDGLYVENGLKIGDIDPRRERDLAFTISDKAKVIGNSVLKGIQYLCENKQKKNM